MMDHQKKNDESVSLSVFEHLDEVRKRFIKCLMLFLFAAVCVYGTFEFVYELLASPVGNLVFLSPQDALVARLIVTWSLALLLVSPYIIFHVWGFIKSGLRENERIAVMFFAPVSFCFFVAGACFAYFVMMPILIHFLLGFKTVSMIPMITVSNYLRFLALLIFSFSIVFQLPLALMLLTKVGLISIKQLTQKRKHAFIVMLIVAAILTPPDVVTQLIVVIPLMFLFEIGILFSKCLNKEKSCGK